MTSTHKTSHLVAANNTSPCVSHSFFSSLVGLILLGLKAKTVRVKSVGTYNKPTNLHAHCQGFLRLADCAGGYHWGNRISSSSVFLHVTFYDYSSPLTNVAVLYATFM